MEKLTLDVLKSAVAGGAAAIRAVTRLEPAGGPGDKVWARSRKEGKYLDRLTDREIPDNAVCCVRERRHQPG